ncbi:hypothetical protein [Lutibacter sp.]|uniref:hypothetical protein n=1 Tax=Lutibacter sp. TaxID=1925666 RepID=UPI0035625414
MHKKIESELVSLAHSILKMENNGDIQVLHKKAQEIYEKLCVLKFVNESLDFKTTEIETEKEVVSAKEVAEVEKVDEKIENIVEVDEEITVEYEEEIEIKVELEESFDEEIIFEPTQKELISEEKIEEVFSVKSTQVKNDEADLPSLKITLEEEFKDAISADIATSLFEKVTVESPKIEKLPKEEPKKKSINDALFNNNIQVGLNDRIAFVKYLFDGSQEDFNRVLSQLNSFTELEEAVSFLNDFVKPDYNWKNKEEFENRLMNLIERKFL